MAIDRALIKWLLVIAAIVLACIWLVLALGATGAAPIWIGPVAVICVAVAVAIPA